MSIVLFSKNYADFKWCLDELLGFFAQAFKDHGWKFDDYRVEGWRKALEDAGKLSGLHLQNDANGGAWRTCWSGPALCNLRPRARWYEEKLVSKIIKEVAKYLKRPSLNVAYHPVGIESRMTEIIELLQMETNDVRIVVVWGSGGLSKTTIVKATFNYICSEFESSSFLEDVKDSEKSTSQNKLIWDLMTDKTPKIKNVPRATEEIRQIFMFQRVLVVLDDINKFEHLEMLAIDACFFCPGSRIIITTRDIASVGSLKINAVYSPEALNEYESLRLFSLYAFGNVHSHKGYEMLTTDVVQYASGIPLVLKTIGSSSSKLSKSEWQDNLRKLKKVPNDDVQGKLKVSFDTLDSE
ncbi:disease resistance protein RPV1-like [Rutidosis leptorrhynchoides]|uniref:disease resistance protein RPV1-like n=1 Tax=Rutidosis leptorrhynchoides TaxID=125765 RepID=UPI003A98DC36